MVVAALFLCPKVTTLFLGFAPALEGVCYTGSFTIRGSDGASPSFGKREQSGFCLPGPLLGRIVCEPEGDGVVIPFVSRSPKKKRLQISWASVRGQMEITQQMNDVHRSLSRKSLLTTQVGDARHPYPESTASFRQMQIRFLQTPALQK